MKFTTKSFKLLAAYIKSPFRYSQRVGSCNLLLYNFSHLSVRCSKYFNKKLFTNFLLTFFLIVISAPLQHSVYGRDQWANGITDGLAIYKPYDESQTRSFLQLLLQ